MVFLHVQDNRHCGEEIEEAVAVFARLQDDRVPLSHAVSAVEQRQSSANHNRGVRSRRHKDMRTHGSGGRLSVRAGDAHRVRVAAHDGPPRFRPFVDRDSSGRGPGNLRIAVRRGGGPDDKVAVAQIFGVVSHADGDAHVPQTENRLTLVHVGPLHR